jgi:hypothetical protein
VPHAKRIVLYGIGMTRKEIIMDNLYSILAEWHPDGDFTEEDLWEAIAESEGVDMNSIMDGDLTEYL